MALISASILNGDLAHLADVAETVRRSGADALHYDVMDGCFVDNLSFGLPVLERLRPCTKLPIDVHLMIQDPLRFVERFIRAGADLLSFHIESSSDPAQTLRAVQQSGIPAGIAVSPDTPLTLLQPLLPLLRPEDFVLLMTVQPGLGGQSFIPGVLPKIRRLREMFADAGITAHIEVDGGINEITSAQCREAGADYLVAGSYLLGSASPAEAVRLLRGL
ncbi:MAG: ribulose-phosphate 3-epimerase [Oscillospiraceae bacterium]|nr:ribulose-phosphate 3-epimerase [Oscillospiraceae bacterium]